MKHTNWGFAFFKFSYKLKYVRLGSDLEEFGVFFFGIFLSHFLLDVLDDSLDILKRYFVCHILILASCWHARCTTLTTILQQVMDLAMKDVSGFCYESLSSIQLELLLATFLTRKIQTLLYVMSYIFRPILWLICSEILVYSPCFVLLFLNFFAEIRILTLLSI